MPANKAVEVQVTVDSVTGAVQSVQVVAQDISPAAKQVIETQVTQALATVQTTTFTSPTTPAPTPPAPRRRPPRRRRLIRKRRRVTVRLADGSPRNNFDARTP